MSFPSLHCRKSCLHIASGVPLSPPGLFTDLKSNPTSRSRIPSPLGPVIKACMKYLPRGLISSIYPSNHPTTCPAFWFQINPGIAPITAGIAAFFGLPRVRGQAAAAFPPSTVKAQITFTSRSNLPAASKLAPDPLFSEYIKNGISKLRNICQIVSQFQTSKIIEGECCPA